MAAANIHDIPRSIALIILSTILFNSCNAVKTEFDVKPGGQEWSMQESLGDVTCKFTYKCQGGTNEKWEIDISADEEQWCRIHRPDGKSYLFFQEFKVEVEGAKVKSAQIYKNSGSIGSNEFKVEAKKVSHTNKFEAELSGVHVELTNGKEEL